MLFNGLRESIVAVGANGDVFVLEHGNNSVVRFDSAGRQLGRLGKKGGGPGELGLALAIASHGDTIAALDVMKRALVRWTTNGDIVPEVSLQGENRRMQGAFAWVNDALLFESRVISDSADGTSLIRAAASDSTLLTVNARRGAPVKFKCPSLSTAQPIFSPAMYWSAAGNGLAANNEQRYVVWIFDGNGRRTTSVRRDIPVRAPTLDDVRLQFPEGKKVSFGGGGGCTVPVEEMVENQARPCACCECFPAATCS